MEKNTLKQVAGYLLGGTLVLLVLPLAFFGLSISMDPLLGFRLIPDPAARIAAAAALALAGVPFAVSSLVYQNRIGKGGPFQGLKIEVSPRTRRLVVTGPYKYTRNPMLFGTAAIYSAYAVLLDSPAALAAVVLFMAFMLTVVRRSEEKRLREDFGQEYEEYRARVSMFLPWPPRRAGGTRAR